MSQAGKHRHILTSSWPLHLEAFSGKQAHSAESLRKEQPLPYQGICYSWVPRQGCEAVLNISIRRLPNKRKDVLLSGDLADQSLLFFETFLLLHWFSRSSLNLGNLSCFLPQVCELHSSFLSLHTTEETITSYSAIQGLQIFQISKLPHLFQGSSWFAHWTAIYYLDQTFPS